MPDLVKNLTMAGLNHKPQSLNFKTLDLKLGRSHKQGEPLYTPWYYKPHSSYTQKGQPRVTSSSS